MLPSPYNLETIQTRAFLLHLESAALLSLLFGFEGQLTPQMIVDQFYKFDTAYQLLKSRVDAVHHSLETGHDPDRELFTHR